MPKVEFKSKARLSRQEAADRLIALGNALSSGSEIELGTGDDTLKLGVAAHLNWESWRSRSTATKPNSRSRSNGPTIRQMTPSRPLHRQPPIPRRRRPPRSPLTIPRLLPRSPPPRAADVPAT